MFALGQLHVWKSTERSIISLRETAPEYTKQYPKVDRKRMG